ncbi:MAG: PAS domain S-box protein, partial [Phycisphaerales bacterium]|nr:PAS domain S-box protein [Phycisphaerales bacterium]
MRRWSMLNLLILVVLAGLCCVDAVPGQTDRSHDDQSAQESGAVVTIGVLAKRGSERCLEKWGPTATYLTEQIPGRRFEIVPLDFSDVDPTVERGEVDFILANPAIYVALEANYGATRIATLKNLQLNGVHTVFGGVIFHRADRSDIRSLDDLRGKHFMAVKENAFGGWLVAWRELKEHGIDPHRDFSELRFGGTHDAVVYAVRDGLVDAGTVRTDTLERMDAEGKIDLADFTVIHAHGGVDHSLGDEEHLPFLHSTRDYPEWPFAKARHTSDELAEQVAVALIGISPDSPAAGAARCAGWTVPLNYQPVHECLKELRVTPYEDFGRITFASAIRTYWYWPAAAGLAAMGGMIVVIVRVVRVNRRLTSVQAQVRESEARYRKLYDDAPVMMHSLDKEGRIRNVNRMWREQFGYERNEVIGMKLGTVLTAALPGQANRDRVARHLADPAAQDVSCQVAGKDGAGIDVLLNTVTCTEPDGRRISLSVVRDVTEQKRAEAALELERRQFRSIFDSIDEVVYISDPTTYELLFMNAAARANWGDSVGRKCYEVLQNRDAPCPFCTNDRIFGDNTGQTHIWEFQNTVNHHWYRCIDKAILWPDGRTVRYEMAIDITKHREAEEELRDSEERYRTITENANDAIITADTTGVIQFWNEAAERIFGYTSKEAVGQNLMDLIVPSQYHDAKRKGMAGFARTGAGAAVGKTLELTALRKDGTEFPIDLSVSGYKDRQGFVAMALVRDITDRKQAEEAVRRSEARFRDIAESMSDWVWEIDADGVYTYCSARVEQVLGYRSDEMIGKTPFDFIEPDEVERVREELARAIEADDPIRDLENWNRTKDGRRVCLLTSGIPIHDEAGEMIGYRGVDSDITDRKQAEEAIEGYMAGLMQAKDELEQRARDLTARGRELEQAHTAADAANLAKSEFLANM